MNPSRLIALTILAMLAFAGNSLLCRLALAQTGIDAASFTTIRLASGALVLWLLTQRRRTIHGSAGNWWSALALFVYAAAFSFAYVSLPAASGALLLFGSVQVTMIGIGFYKGERLRPPQIAGYALALAGLVGLLLPGISAPAPFGAALMLASGIAWGVYSLRGRGAGDPALVTAGNFLRAAPIALVLSAIMLSQARFDAVGIAYAVASGALTSGLGYIVWYTALPRLSATRAAIVQLSVPVIAALGGVLLLGEAISLRLLLASVAILGGIAIAIRPRPANPASPVNP